MGGPGVMQAPVRLCMPCHANCVGCTTLSMMQGQKSLWKKKIGQHPMPRIRTRSGCTLIENTHRGHHTFCV